MRVRRDGLYNWWSTAHCCLDSLLSPLSRASRAAPSAAPCSASARRFKGMASTELRIAIHVRERAPPPITSAAGDVRARIWPAPARSHASRKRRPRSPPASGLRGSHHGTIRQTPHASSRHCEASARRTGRARTSPRSGRLIGPSELGQKVRLAFPGDTRPPRERGSGGERHPHLMPDARQSVAERVDARRPDRDESRPSSPRPRLTCQAKRRRFPGRMAPRATAPAALSPAPPANTGRTLMPPTRGEFPSKTSGRLAAGDEPRHRCERKACRRERRFGPGPCPDVEPERPGRVGHVFDGFPRQLETKPCLGKQHRCGPGEDIRFVPANPKQLRSGETRHGAVAGNGAEVGERSLEEAAFRRLARLSFQRMHGRRTFASRSSSTAPCICPESPIPATAETWTG